ncbi:MAG: transcriptional regulator [Candidatus Krumholzibacteria bacterium]|nr:transcriptional regulator [Candidatus Krumholzibacteria bacterium]
MEKERGQFIETWGSLGVLWGINRSMARIHAFIMLCEDPVDLETVCRRLRISRGNASMSLKELRSWGVIHRVHMSGERRDFYVAEPDNWKMIFKIAAQRKEREFDPALQALQDLLGRADLDSSSGVRARLGELERTMTTFDRLARKFLGNEQASRIVVDMLKKFKV